MSTPVDNVTLRNAIEAFSIEPGQETYLEVIRTTLQGQLLLDATGSDRPTVAADGSASYPAGAKLQFGGGSGPDGLPALFVYTSQEQVQRMHPEAPDEVQSIVQPAVSALQLVAGGEQYGWLYLDPAGPTCAISSNDAALALASDRNDEVKNALEGDDPEATKQAVLDALALNGSLLLAVDSASIPSDALAGEGVVRDTSVSIRSSLDRSGFTVLLAFTSGLEVNVRHPDDAFATKSVAEVLQQATEEPYHGLVINPGGPWIGLTPDDIRSVLARMSRPLDTLPG